MAAGCWLAHRDSPRSIATASSTNPIIASRLRVSARLASLTTAASQIESPSALAAPGVDDLVPGREPNHHGSRFESNLKHGPAVIPERGHLTPTTAAQQVWTIQSVMTAATAVPQRVLAWKHSYCVSRVDHRTAKGAGGEPLPPSNRVRVGGPGSDRDRRQISLISRLGVRGTWHLVKLAECVGQGVSARTAHHDHQRHGRDSAPARLGEVAPTSATAAPGARGWDRGQACAYSR